MGSRKPRIKPRGRIGTKAIGRGIHYTAIDRNPPPHALISMFTLLEKSGAGETIEGTRQLAAVMDGIRRRTTAPYRAKGKV